MDDLYRTWKGYHHVSGSVPWLLTLRKGDTDICTGQWQSRAICGYRYLQLVHAGIRNRRPELQWSRKIKGGLNDYKGLALVPAPECMTTTPRPNSCSCTSSSLVTVAVWKSPRWGDSPKRISQGAFREGTGVTSSLVDLYLGTGDASYLELAQNSSLQFWTADYNPATAFFGPDSRFVPRLAGLCPRYRNTGC